jgi:hypothetical protein
MLNHAQTWRRGRPGVNPLHLIRCDNILTASTALTAHDEDDELDISIPPLKGLGFLDRFLVIWIILAMAIGIILGNTVPSTGPALQQGQFVGVSVPIGTSHSLHGYETELIFGSCWPPGHDVSYIMQSPL